MEACPKKVMTLFSETWKDLSYHITFQKDQQFCKKNTFDLAKFKFPNELETKMIIFWDFLRHTAPLQTN